MNVQTQLTDNWCLQSPVYATEGDTRYYAIEFLGVTTVASPTVTVYNKKREITSTIMPSGSHTVSGNILTMKPAAFPTGASGRYVISAKVTCDGSDIKTANLMVIVRRAHAEQ